jgi:hypothetical protein
MTTTRAQRIELAPNCGICGRKLDHDDYIRACVGGDCGVRHGLAFERGQDIDARRDRIAGEDELREAKREGRG